MKRFFILVLFICTLSLTGCSVYPGGNDSRPDSQVSSVPETSSEPDSAPEFSSESDSVPEEESSEEAPESDAFIWITDPVIQVDMMLPLRDADRPGYFSTSSSVCFVNKGLMGLMNQSGEILLPAEYTDICYSRTQGGFLALKEGSTVYQLLNNQYEPVFDVEYDTRKLLAETPYLWDPQNEVILDSSNDNAVYEGTDFVVVQQGADSPLYALGNGSGLSTDFVYTGWGPTGLTNQFFLQDDIGWHLVSPAGDDLLQGLIIKPRLQRQFSLERSVSSSVSYIEAAPYPCSEGVYALQNAEGYQWGFYDVSGSPIIDGLFEDACPVSLGRAWVQWNGAWGLIEIRTGIAVG